MNPNQYVTPETGKLLEEAGLIKKGDTLFAWFKVKGRLVKKWNLIYWPSRVADYDRWEYIPAPTLGEIWEMLPEYIQHEYENYEKRLKANRICYALMIDWQEIRALKKIEIENSNPADAAGRLLYQLHKDVKLNQKGE